MLISTGGTVIKMPVDGIRRIGRATQGVIVMRLRGDEIVSSLAPVVESEESEPAEGAAAPDAAAEAPEADVDFDDPDELEDEDDEPDADDEPDDDE